MVPGHSSKVVDRCLEEVKFAAQPVDFNLSVRIGRDLPESADGGVGILQVRLEFADDPYGDIHCGLDFTRFADHILGKIGGKTINVLSPVNRLLLRLPESLLRMKTPGLDLAAFRSAPLAM